MSFFSNKILLLGVVVAGFSNVICAMDDRDQIEIPLYDGDLDFSSNENWIMVPERFYVVVEEKPIFLGPLSPCIGVVFYGQTSGTTLVFHHQASNSIESMANIAKQKMDMDVEEKIIVTIVSRETSLNEFGVFIDYYGQSTNEEIFYSFKDDLHSYLNDNRFEFMVNFISYQANHYSKFFVIESDGKIYSIDNNMLNQSKVLANNFLALDRTRIMLNNFRRGNDENAVIFDSYQEFMNAMTDLRYEIIEMVSKLQQLGTYTSLGMVDFMEVPKN